jgi:hypothetical protein
MKLQPKPLHQQRAQHPHLLQPHRRHIPRRHRLNTEVLRIHPSRPTGDRLRVQVIRQRKQRLHRVIRRDPAMRPIHPEQPPRLRICLHRLDRRNLERIERRPPRRRLRQHPTPRSRQHRHRNPSPHNVPLPQHFHAMPTASLQFEFFTFNPCSSAQIRDRLCLSIMLTTMSDAHAFLARPPRLPHRPHRLQRRLARPLARLQRCRRPRLRPRPRHRPQPLHVVARVGAAIIDDIRGDIRNPAALEPALQTSRRKSSSTWPPSPSSAPRTTTPSAPTRPTSSAPRASSTPSAAHHPCAPSSP